MLYSLCYPIISSKDDEFIRLFRDEYDLPFKDVVSHHFTIAFGISGVEINEYTAHIREQATVTEKINFNCRYAMLGNDDSNDDYYVFLVPDEGFSEISLLHDRVYTGLLAPYLRLDIPYIPHIGIATIADSKKVKSLCDHLNRSNLHVTGSLEGITVCEYDGTVVKDKEYLEFSA